MNVFKLSYTYIFKNIFLEYISLTTPYPFFDFSEIKSTHVHFSKQVVEAHYVFVGMSNNKTQSLEIVSLGFEHFLPVFLIELDS